MDQFCLVCKNLYNFNLIKSSSNVNWPICEKAKFDSTFNWLIHLNLKGGIINKTNYLETILEALIVCFSNCSLNDHWLKNYILFRF